MELGFLQLKPTSIFQDTSSCVASAHNVHLRGRSKQVAPRVCFIQEFIQDRIISTNNALLQCRLPDIGIKALPRVSFEPLTDQLYSYRHVGSK